ncbi:hypothetical protein H5410_027610 [Solanum commersonii]|uniref:Uncharacterized protein n=1 Tax=Solanum commersonii TaxID=4109 RepID=A0A9J5Z4Y6_SOLCO|nr:hypothetical protein H5410_027610 [Solanum commersonii]
MQQAPPTTCILSNILIHNNYADLAMQEHSNKNNAGESTNIEKSDHGVQTVERSRDDSPTESSHTRMKKLQKDHVTTTMNNKTPGIDLSLPLPHSPNERVTNGGNLTHVMHEGVQNDLYSDLRAPATTIQNIAKTILHVHEIQNGTQVPNNGKGGHNQADSTGAGTETNNQIQKKKGTTSIEGREEYNNIEEEIGEKTPNNKLRGKISKKKRQAIKRRQRVETGYRVIMQKINRKSKKLALAKVHKLKRMSILPCSLKMNLIKILNL